MTELVRSMRPFRVIVMTLQPRVLVQRGVGRRRKLQVERVRWSPVLLERGGRGRQRVREQSGKQGVVREAPENPGPFLGGEDLFP